jgi:Co/Zn/Cd efflux system component
MRSTWLCSRNDLIANVGVLFAAGKTYLLASRWPDIIVGTTTAGLYLYLAARVLSQSIRASRVPLTPAAMMRVPCKEP